uniref:tRNA(Ile)-lysidine synthase n=1 Tax=Porphyridium purpureum TaxID=35688 RepID=A0A343KNW1_PORPP|nr:tRNA(Ile)-lysidine synthase [Porphyridium purpureum]
MYLCSKLLISLTTFVHFWISFLLGSNNDWNIIYYWILNIFKIEFGQDSISLLKLLSDLTELDTFNILAIHFDHQWRVDSKINCTYYCFNSNSFKDDEVSSRKWRYNELIVLSSYLNIEYIATAHTSTDKVETLFYNLMRGTGLNGGITSNSEILYLTNKIKIIRPLFNITRNEIYWLTRKFFIPIWTDFTNFNYNKTRNKIRNELIPYIKNQFNPRLDSELCKFINNLVYEFDYIQLKACFLYKMIVHPIKNSLNRNVLKKLHPAIQLRIITIFLYPTNQSNNFDIYFNHINKNIKNTIFSLDHGYYLYIGENWLHILKRPDNIPIIN